MTLRRVLALALCAGLAAAHVPAAFAQDAAPPDASSCCAGMVRLNPGTPLRLMVVNEVSTRTARPGDRFALRVDAPVVVEGVTVIPVGAKAWGEVLSAEGSGIVGKSGKLAARLLSVEVGGAHLGLTGESRTAGAGGTTETVLGVIGLGPLGLIAHGNNAKLKAGDVLDGALASGALYDPATGRLYSQPTGQPPPPQS